MKILFMVFDFPPRTGGGSVVIVELANKLADLGHDITVLAPDLSWNGTKYEPKINKKITVHKVPTPLRTKTKVAARLCYFNMKRKGIELGKQIDYDFIFTIFHPFHMVPKAAVSCGKKLGKPVIIKIDDAIYEKSRGLKNIQRKFEKTFNSKTLQNADKILVMNEYTKNLVNDYYQIPDEKMSIVTNGTDLKNFYTKKANNNRIIFSGVMFYHRGIDVLLNAALQVAKKISNSEFLLVGDGPEMQKLQETVKTSNLSKNIIFKGWVDRGEIPEFLATSAIGIGPLRKTDVTRGALPIKVLEYLAASLPILAMEGTLTKEVLDDGANGYVVTNSDELAKKIIYLLENKFVRDEMGTRSRIMSEKFDWKNIAESIINEYQMIISSK